MFKYFFLFLLANCLLMACTSKDNTKLSIQFAADRSTIVISNIEAAALLQLKNNLPKDSLYQDVVTVLETPGDDDSVSIEKEWPGKLKMQENELVFTPDSPFVKGKSYLIESLLNVSFGNVKQLLKGEMKTTLNFQQKILKR